MRLDGHAHVFLKDLPMVAGRRYTPVSDALPDTYFAHLRRHDLEGAVLVQPSFLGYDNSYLLEVLDGNRSNPDGLKLLGVCMVDPVISAQGIQDLRARGIIGVRLNCVGRAVADFSSEPWPSFFAKIRDAGWHLEIHIEHDRLLRVLENFPPSLQTVIDHFCLADSEVTLRDLLVRACDQLDPDNLFVKLSAPYRLPEHSDKKSRFETADHLAQALTEQLGFGQLVWGSDWPFTQHEERQTYDDCVSQGKKWLKNAPHPFGTFSGKLLVRQSL